MSMDRLPQPLPAWVTRTTRRAKAPWPAHRACAPSTSEGAITLGRLDLDQFPRGTNRSRLGRRSLKLREPDPATTNRLPPVRGEGAGAVQGAEPPGFGQTQ